ncbi:MAG: hypothetical protein MZV63_16175, partial [Marinilabiliales bacterium]|nr:hypothetical protein [Marinilabiliales bacterium]
GLRIAKVKQTTTNGIDSTYRYYSSRFSAPYISMRLIQRLIIPEALAAPVDESYSRTTGQRERRNSIFSQGATWIKSSLNP